MDKETYVSEIKSGLKGLPEGEAMIEEIESHIEHHLFRSFQEGKSEEEAMQTLLQAFGTPTDIVSSFKKIQPVTFRAFLMFHLFCNSALFAVGIAITIMHVWLESPFVQAVWKGISVSVWLILAAYMIYWVLIGYQGVKEFGKRGKKACSTYDSDLNGAKRHFYACFSIQCNSCCAVSILVDTLVCWNLCFCNAVISVIWPNGLLYWQASACLIF